MKVLVTGASGFIGRYVVEELIYEGHSVVAFDHHHPHALHKDYGGAEPGVEVFLGDVRDDVAVVEAMAHCQGFIHLAAVLGTQETIKNPRPAAMSNMLGGLNILEAAAQYGIPGVYICVGNHWMLNTYSISKTVVERFVEMFNKERGTRVNRVRVVNAYGPRQTAAAPFGHSQVRKITPAFVCRALSGIPIEVYGDGMQISDMVYVADVARTLVASLMQAVSTDPLLEQVVEIGPPKSKNVNFVAKLVAQYSAELVGGGPVAVRHLPMRPGEIEGAKVTADVRTLAQVGINPEELTTLEDGMRQTVKWYHDNQGSHWHRVND